MVVRRFVRVCLCVQAFSHSLSSRTLLDVFFYRSNKSKCVLAISSFRKRTKVHKFSFKCCVLNKKKRHNNTNLSHNVLCECEYELVYPTYKYAHEKKTIKKFMRMRACASREHRTDDTKWILITNW